MLLNQSISISISYLRVLALFMIVSCHLLQAQNNRWAWVLNMGVQIFLFVSGFLYGHFGVNNFKTWYLKRFRRIYIPLFIWCLVYLILLLIFRAESVETKKIFSTFLCLQQLLGGVAGLEHLWFVTAILICYLLTPLYNALKQHSNILIVFLLLFFALELFVLHFYTSFFIPIFVYSFAFFYVNIKRFLQYLCSGILFAFSVFLFYDFNPQTYMLEGSLFYNAFHVCWPLTISLLIIELRGFITINKKSDSIGFLEKYSYEIYLVHHPFIIGPVSLLFVTNIKAFNIFLILLITLILSYLLKIISSKVEKIENLL